MLLNIRIFSLQIVLSCFFVTNPLGAALAKETKGSSQWHLVNETFINAIARQNQTNSTKVPNAKINALDTFYLNRFDSVFTEQKPIRKKPIPLPRLRKKPRLGLLEKKVVTPPNTKTNAEKGVWRLEMGNEDRGIFVDLWEPIFDPIFGGSPTDGGMSWGLHLSYTPNSKNPDWFQWVRAYMPWLDNKTPAHVSYSIEQSANMHSHLTRKNRGHSEHLWTSDQRPDAGYLAGNARIGLQSPFSPRWHRIDTIDFSTGIVGPYSGAQSLHQIIHDLIGGSTDKWHQINSEPFANVNYGYGHRFFLWEPKGGETIEIHPHVGFALGTAFTHAKAGLNLRVGRSLENDMGAPRFSQMLTGTNFPKMTKNVFSWNFFSGLEGKAHGYNVTLDENLLTGGGQEVKSHTYTYDVQAGFEFGYSDYRLTFMNVYRSREFKGQQHSAEFIRVALAAEF